MTKILVIDDEVMERDEILTWLHDAGYEAIGISESQAEVEYILHSRADLVIYDIARSVLDGYGVWLEVDAHLAATQIPFIFLTDGSSQEDMRRGMDPGTDHNISKPFDGQELLQAVQARLEKATTQQQKHRRDVEKLQSVLVEEREQRMLDAKMVAMFSHDFRNPLTIILTANQLLRDYSDRMEVHRRLVHMNRIEAASRQLLEMLDDMLVIAQMDAGKLDFDPEPLHIDQFLEQIVEEFHILHSTTHQVVFENHFTATALVDPRLLRQIAVNLISNAIKYSPQGGEIRVVLDEDERQQCVLAVYDQGIGILEADRDRLFDAFERGSNVSSVIGTGLGLAIVKQAVDQHGGTVHIESQSGRGTTISVTI